MKRFAHLLLSLLILTGLFLGTLSPVASAHTPGAANLVANPSAETEISPGQPEKWTPNKWGTNSANLTYESAGNSGSRSLKTEVTSYTNGDAKWYFDPVNVSPNTNYTFGEFYKSNAPTEVIVQYTNTDGSNSYQWLETAAVSANWADKDLSFTTPSNAVKASVFHVVAQVGWLIIDDASLTLTQQTPPPAGGNLIANSSLENGSSSPQNWTSNKWGSLTAAFSHTSGSHTGSRSGKTTVSRYTSGDAKWYFTPVTINPSTAYNYSHYYQSNIQTQAIVQFTDAAGAVSYELLGNVQASSEWKVMSYTINTPTSARKVSVFHVVNRVGWLSIDDATMTPRDTTPIPIENPIPNPSLETVSGNSPASWTTGSWGANSPAFEYMSDGHTGSRSVKVTVSNYASGDAKWLFNPITTLQRGTNYRFSAWYRGNVQAHPIAMFTKDNGVINYVGLQAPLTISANEWKQYSDTFTVPQDVASVSLFFFVASNGWLQTDDYTLTPYSAQPFSRAMVSLTFDDGIEDNVSTAIPIMNAHGFKSAQCFATTFIEDANNEQAMINKVMSAKNTGHEICSHTVTHPFLSQLSQQDVAYELSHSKQYLESITGSPIRNFASPYGDYNASVNQQIAQYYRSHRTVDAGYNSKDNFDIYRLRVQNMLSTTTIEEFQSWLDYAESTNTWLILVYHRVATNPGQFDTHTNDFTNQMQALANSGLAVRTYNDALDEVLAQL